MIPSVRRRALLVLLLPVLALALSGAARSAPLATVVRPPVGADPVRGLSRLEPPATEGAQDLPPSTEQPVPPPPFAPGAPLQPHELFGFAPYWTLSQSAGFDVTKLSTIAYFGVDCAPDGSLVQSGPGLVGYQSEALTTLISRAHVAGDRVVLTLKCFDPATIHAIISSPQAAARLAGDLVTAVSSRSMDGANLDFEGTGSGDRAGYTQLATALAGALHAADPHWQVSVDSYATSASDPQGFVDVAALGGAVDSFFVMAYDMNQDGSAAPTAPLTGYHWNDTAAVAAYTAVVPPSKVILGTPFYGHTWTTSDKNPGSQPLGGPSPVTFAEVAAAGHPVYWDAQGQVPWTSYQDDQQQWHQTWYDNSQSLALKARLADRAQLRGVGIWALGMDGGDGSLIAALLGSAGPLRQALGKHDAGPAATPATPAPAAAAPAPHPGAAPPGSAPPPAAHGGSPPPPPPPASGPPPPAPAPTPVPTAAPTPTPTPAPTPTPNPLPFGL